MSSSSPSASDPSQTSPSSNPAIQAAVQFSNSVPHNRDLGMLVESLGSASAIMRLPYRDLLIGDSERGWIYSSVLYSLADATSGMAVFCALSELTSIATLDLRIDYLRPTLAGHDLIAHAVCYRLARQVAFTRCTLRLEGDDEICAIATGTFFCGKRAGTHTISTMKD